MESQATPAAGFKQKLGLFDATMMVAGSMIGSGIFIVSAGIVREVGGAGWLLAVWLLAGLLTLIGALTYAELAAMLPQAGGQYIFLREAYGSLWAFLYGWTSFLVIQSGTIAAVAVAFAKYLAVFFPSLGTDVRWLTLFDRPVRLGLRLPGSDGEVYLVDRAGVFLSPGQFVAVALVVLLTLINVLGIEMGRLVQNLFTVAKILGLAALIVIGLFVVGDFALLQANLRDPFDQGTATWERALILWPMAAPVLVLAGAMVGALFSSDAWHNVTFIAGEVKNPARTLPGSLVLGTLLVIVLYLLANVAYLTALPLHGNPQGSTAMERGIAYARDDRVATAVMEEAMPVLGVGAMAILIMISTLGCNNGLILMGPRLYYAMARDGLYFEDAARLSRNGVPVRGLWYQAAWTCLLIFTGTYSELLDYVIFAALVFYVLTVASVFVLRWRRPELPRPYRAFGYPWLPLLYIMLCATLALALLAAKPTYSWPSFLIVLAGIPVYYFWRWQPEYGGET